MSSSLKKSLLNGVTFGIGASVTVLIVSLVYAATTYYVDLPTATSGSQLTATGWNAVVNYANKAVKQETEILTLTGGKAGIGTINPGAALEVNGNIIAAAPTASNQVATKAYVDAATWGGGWVSMISSASASLFSHSQAANYCYTLSSAAAAAMNGDTTTVYTDWRLPTLQEAAVFEWSIGGPLFWTTTPAGNPSGYLTYWFLSDPSGGTSYAQYNSVSYNARCIR